MKILCQRLLDLLLWPGRWWFYRIPNARCIYCGRMGSKRQMFWERAWFCNRAEYDLFEEENYD
jgi:hypothetical protein